MFINRMKALEAELATADVRRRVAEAGELDCDAIGMLILDEALRQTVEELARYAGVRGEGHLEELS